jgi:hypothetical protein
LCGHVRIGASPSVSICSRLRCHHCAVRFSLWRHSPLSLMELALANILIGLSLRPHKPSMSATRCRRPTKGGVRPAFTGPMRQLLWRQRYRLGQWARHAWGRRLLHKGSVCAGVCRSPEHCHPWSLPRSPCTLQARADVPPLSGAQSIRGRVAAFSARNHPQLLTFLSWTVLDCARGRALSHADMSACGRGLVLRTPPTSTKRTK